MYCTCITNTRTCTVLYTNIYCILFFIPPPPLPLPPPPPPLPPPLPLPLSSDGGS